MDPEERGGRGALISLALSLVLAMATWFSASAVIPQLRSEWGLSDSTAAWLTIVVQLGFVLGAVTSSIFNLPDIVAPQRVMLLSALGAAGVNLLLVTVDSGSGAVPLRFATGFFLAGIYPPALKLIAT